MEQAEAGQAAHFADIPPTTEEGAPETDKEEVASPRKTDGIVEWERHGLWN
jgi:hypothetical protein